MIRKLLLAPLFTLGLVLAMAAPASSAPTGDIIGSWTSVDPVDGSQQSLLVTSFDTGFKLVFYDNDDTVECDSVALLATGAGIQTSTSVSGSIRGMCFDGTRAGPFPVEFTYAAGPPETLTDGSGTVWTRSTS